MKVLIAYASGHGSTGEVAQFIGDVLKEHDIDVAVQLAGQVQTVSEYDAFIVGSPIYGGMWLTEISQFFDRFKGDLSGKPVYMWIMCIRVLEADGIEHALREYIHRPTLDEVGVKDVAVFAGKLNLASIDWNERWTLAARYDGDTLPGTRNDDFRDWDAIRTWAKHMREELMPV
jgi:menaquinone-dependent protoporphyrinogen oxidase